MVETFLRRADVMRLTGLSCSTIYAMMANDKFPKNFSISPGLVAWRESEVAKWQQERLAERDSKPAPVNGEHDAAA